MPGVSVSIEGTVTGTITDIDGRYQLKIGKEQHNATLVFSFIGMQTQHIAYKGQHQLNVTLRDDHVALEDVVVIGYGSKNRKSLTSSISSVKKEDIERMAPVSHNIQDLLGGGMVKGVLATQNSGEPGASITINVRGVTAPYPNMQTGTNNNAPLYVIDGVPLFAESTSINPLQNLSPNDIESIDVLKDASATAIYGSRGANGVIICNAIISSGCKVLVITQNLASPYLNTADFILQCGTTNRNDVGKYAALMANDLIVMGYMQAYDKAFQ